MYQSDNVTVAVQFTDAYTSGIIACVHTAHASSANSTVSVQYHAVTRAVFLAEHLWLSASNYCLLHVYHLSFQNTCTTDHYYHYYILWLLLLRLQIQEGRCVSMRGLRKVYDNGKVAVEGLDLDLFEGQISVLLGQNGAGVYTKSIYITMQLLVLNVRLL
jgi:ABC-type glutathione transport system ATPase component